MYWEHYAKYFDIEEDRVITQFMDWITEFIEGDDSLGLDQQVVLAGRQPSLHRFSVRAFYVKIVQSKAIQIHPLSCKGYNADFDGDTMWLVALITEEAKKKLSKRCLQNTILLIQRIQPLFWSIVRMKFLVVTALRC